MGALILASASARRREIIESLGLSFEVRIHELDESLFDHLPPAERVQALARAKAEAVLGEAPGAEAILGADTLVCEPEALGEAQGAALRDAGGWICLGKPASREEARLMIELLSGRSHWVHTGLALLLPRRGGLETALSSSRVSFAPIAEAELEAYLDSGEWEGVAGGYRIQGLAARYIERIEGSWSGIVGLPIRELYAILSRLSREMPALQPGNFRPSGRDTEMGAG